MYHGINIEHFKAKMSLRLFSWITASQDLKIAISESDLHYVEI